ncbi:PREDICTED: transmembrane protein 104 homolog, partial [Rhagoletis zephyria]|uniref:transmembrane protein 104 homolog n=1 Tax=Rhagoletis zephyria TaxID=28612 RepID=UPI00081158AB
MDEEDKYNLVIGLIFIFNLLLGTGVLAIPHVFQKVGYLVGSTIIAALAAVSYFTVTCLLEAMANANFIKRFQALVHSSSSSSSSSTFEEEISIVDKDNEGAKKQKKKKGCRVRKVSGSFVNAAFQASSCDFEQIEAPNSSTSSPPPPPPPPLTADLFSIDTKFELGELTDLFLPRLLSKFFFLSIAVYLFGDLLIFNVMMAKSARELLCTAPRPAQCNLTHWAAATLNEDEKEEMFQSLLSGDTLQEDLLPCWVSSAPAGLTRGGVYQLSLLAFVALLLPLTFAGLKKTTLLQVATIVLRWLAFISMVGLAVRTIVLDGGPRGHPAAIDMPFVPTMFGVCVYGFMAHHSVPSILTAVREKRRLFGGLQLVYLLVVGCYLLISLTGAFAFAHLEDVYTLNF